MFQYWINNSAFYVNNRVVSLAIGYICQCIVLCRYGSYAL